MKIRLKELMALCLIVFLLCSPYFLKEYKKTLEIKKNAIERPWQGVLILWDYPRRDFSEDGSKYGWLRGVITAYEKENQGTLIEFVPMEKEEMQTRLATAQKVGELPDIAPLDGENFLGYEIYYKGDEKKYEQSSKFVKYALLNMEGSDIINKENNQPK